MKPSPQGIEVIVICLIFTALATVLLGLRLLARSYTKLKLGRDDALMVLSWIFAVGQCSVSVALNFYGQGQHMQSMPLPDLVIFFKLFDGELITYNIALTLAKVSILMQYLRIFVMARKFRIACWVFIGLMSCYGIVMFFITVFMCTPVSYFWDHTTKGHCLATLPLWYSSAAVNILTDFAILGLPMPVLSSLTIPKHKKYWLMFVFAFGGGVCVISIVRVTQLKWSSEDITWDNVPASIWSNVEVTVAIICGCVPCLKPLVVKLFPCALSTPSKIDYSRDSEGHLGLPDGGKSLHNKASTDFENMQNEARDDMAGNAITVTDEFAIVESEPVKLSSEEVSKKDLGHNQH